MGVRLVSAAARVLGSVRSVSASLVESWASFWRLLLRLSGLADSMLEGSVFLVASLLVVVAWVQAVVVLLLVEG